MRKIVMFIFLCVAPLAMFAQQKTSGVGSYEELTTDFEVTVEVMKLDESGNITEKNFYFLEVDFVNSSSSTYQLVYYKPLEPNTLKAIGVAKGQARIRKGNEEYFMLFLQDVLKKAGIVRGYHTKEIHNKA